MEYHLLFFVLVVIGGLCAYFYSAINNATNDEKDEISDMAAVDSDAFGKLIADNEKIIAPLLLAEHFFYSSAVSVALVFTAVNSTCSRAIEILDLSTVFAIYSIAILLLKTIFTALGHRFSKYILTKQWMAAYAVSTVFKTFSLVLERLFVLISGRPAENALEELDDLVETAHDEGELEHGEYRLLKNIMQFSDVLVSDVMTPRTVVFSLSSALTASAALLAPELQMYSRIPIWQGSSLDEGAIGYVMSKDIMKAVIQGRGECTLGSLARELQFIPDNASLDVALESFLEKRQHAFLVVDEYGGIDGLITMEDVLETILGAEIVDEADRFVDLRELAKHRRDRRIAGASDQS